MELKLVYRGLRQISDWALRFYSDVYVDGVENVPKDGPVIVYVSNPYERSPKPSFTIAPFRTRNFLNLRMASNPLR